MILRIVVIRGMEYGPCRHTWLQSTSNVLLHHPYRQTDGILVGATLKGKALNHVMLHMAYQARFQKAVDFAQSISASSSYQLNH
jgi:hypothetical protein